MSASADGPADAAVGWAVSQVVHLLFHHLDGGRFEAAAGLFAHDGTWYRQGDQLTGPDAVLEALRARSHHLRTRHLATNLVVTGDAARAQATYYVTVFDHQAAGQGEGPAVLTTPMAIFLIDDVLKHEEGVWRFAERRPRMVFKRA